MGSIFQSLWEMLINGVMQIVLWVWYMLQEVIGTVLDMLTQLFFIFSGMTPISSNGAGSVDLADGSTKKIDIIRLFTGNEVFQRAYFNLALVALGLVVVFTIAKIIKQDYFEKAGPRSKGPIFRDMILSFIAFLCIVPLFSFVIQAAGALAVLVMDAMGYEGGGIGTMLFEMSWSDGGASIRGLAESYGSMDYNRDVMNWYPDDIFYYYFWDSEHAMLTHDMIGKVREVTAHGVTVQFMREEYYWYIFVFAGAILCKTFLEMVISMVSRLFKLVALFIVSPSPISQIVLDGGAKFKQWKDMFLQEALKVVGIIMCFMTFIMITGMVNDIDLMKYAFTDDAASSVKNLIESNALTAELNNEVDILYYGQATEAGPIDNLMNALGKALILLAGMGAIKDMDSVITPLLAGGKSSLDGGATGNAFLGKDGIMSSVAKGAVGITKTGVGWASSKVGEAARLVGGASGAVTSGLAGWLEDRKSKMLEKQEKEVDGENRKIQTPTQASATGENLANDAGKSEEAPNPSAEVPAEKQKEVEAAQENLDNASRLDNNKNVVLDELEGLYDKYNVGEKDENGKVITHDDAKEKMTDEDKVKAEQLENAFDTIDSQGDSKADAEKKLDEAKKGVKSGEEDGAAKPAEKSPTEQIDKEAGAAKPAEKSPTEQSDKEAGAAKPAEKSPTEPIDKKVLNKAKARVGVHKFAKGAKKVLNGVGKAATGFKDVVLNPIGSAIGSTAKAGVSIAGILAKTAADIVGWGGVADVVEGAIGGGVQGFSEGLNGKDGKSGLSATRTRQKAKVAEKHEANQQTYSNILDKSQALVNSAGAPVADPKVGIGENMQNIKATLRGAKSSIRKNGMSEDEVKETAKGQLKNIGRFEDVFDTGKLEKMIQTRKMQPVSKRDLKKGITPEGMERERDAIQKRYEDAIRSMEDAIDGFDPTKGYGASTRSAVSFAEKELAECAEAYAKLEKKLKGKEKK